MAGVHRTQVCKPAHTVYGCPGSGSRADQSSAEIAWRPSWKKRSWHRTKRSTGFPGLRRGRSSEAQVPLPEPVSPETSSPSHHPHILPATPRSSLWPSALQHSALLHKRSAPLQEGHLLLPPHLRLSPLTALASRGWGPQSWTHPIEAPQLSQPDRLTVGLKTPEP